MQLDVACCVTLHKASLKCDLFNVAYYVQHIHTLTELVASFPLEFGPERTVQAGIEE